MRQCRIESLGVSLPERRVLPRGSMRHAVTAGKHCIRSSKYAPADIQVLINSGVHRDNHVCEPAIAVYIQHRLGINIEFQGRETLAFDLHNGGCGMLNAIQILCALMESGQIRVGMTVASEANSDRKPDPAYPYPDSGAAIILDRSPLLDRGFGHFAFHCREEYADLYTSIVDISVPRGRIRLQRAAELEAVYLGMIPHVIEEVLAKDNLTPEDIDRLIPAQISPGFLDQLPRMTGIPENKITGFPADLPDTLSTSLFLTLERSLAEKPANPGETFLLLACGSGVTVAATTYRF